MLFCSRLPSNIQGGVDLRVRNQILALASLGPTAVFALTGSGKIVTPSLEMWRSSTDPKSVEDVNTMTILSKVVSENRGTYWNRFSYVTANELESAIREFKTDVIIVSRLALMPYAQRILDTGVKTVVLDMDEPTFDTRTSIASIIDNPGVALLYKRYSEALTKYEKEMVSLSSCVWLSSKQESEKFVRSHPTFENYFIVPNVVNADEYEIAPEKRILVRIIFAANVAYEPNLDGVHFILDELLPRLPSASIDLVGAHMVDWVRKIVHSQVNVVGQVAGIAPYFSQASVAIVPLRAGGGTRLKALEAMASGVPVVSTSFGVEGLDVADGHDVLIADGADAFAKSCSELEEDAQLRKRLVTNALFRVRDQYSLPKLKISLASALQSA